MTIPVIKQITAADNIDIIESLISDMISSLKYVVPESHSNITTVKTLLLTMWAILAGITEFVAFVSMVK